MRISDWSSDVCSSDLGVCPVCDTPSERGRETARALQVTLATVRGESAAVERVRPRLVEYGGTLEVEIRQLNSDLRQVDDRSEERRVGQEGVSTCRSRRSRYH